MGRAIAGCSDVRVDFSKRYQEIDGFGVNINSKCWNNGGLIPVMDMLVDDLGATLYRLDAYGKSNWVDPGDEFDENILNERTYNKVYAGIDFKNAESMAKYLNLKGIEPYMTLSGVVPKWMCAKDGVTLENYDKFADMAVSYIEWAKKAGVKFKLFGPLNETDIGPPEGPKVSPQEFVKVLEVLVDALDKNGLKDIKLVAPEQCRFNLEYLKELLKSRKLIGRIEVFGFHCYNDMDISEAVNSVEGSSYREARVWLTEYGDLDQTGENEWFFSRVIFERLLRALKGGARAALNWDAFDNYHDHDEAWTIYGLIRSAKNIYTPKKRYYSVKQAYRFIKPGFIRAEAVSSSEEIPALVFVSPDGKDFSLIGMNKSRTDVSLNVSCEDSCTPLSGIKMKLYRTTADENCVHAGDVLLGGKSGPGAELILPASSIFTLTTL